MTVGLLYPGEMGSSFAQLLIGRGVRVVSTLAGRSDRTAALARAARVELLPSLEQVVRESSVIFSIVSTSAAMDMAEAYCELAHFAPESSIYVDLNSIGPELARSIAEKVSNAGHDFVDGAINGLAKNLTSSATLFLSGKRAAGIAALVGASMRIRSLGDEPGQASTMKMLLGGLSKGMCGLFAELAVLAERRQMLPQMLEACEMIYPGMMQLIDRMLPTYAKHAGRRAVEMRELEQTICNSGLEPCVAQAIRALHEHLAEVPFDPRDGAGVSEFVQRIANESSSVHHEPTAV